MAPPPALYCMYRLLPQPSTYGREADFMGATGDLVNALSKVMDNQDGLSGCPLCQTCHDYLTPKQYSECLNDKNLCPKADMVKI